MKKLITLALVGASALAVTATSASAQSYYRGPDRGYHSDHGWQNINARQAQLDRRIDQGLRNRTLTRAEASRLRAEFRQIARLEARYRTNGLSSWERADLDRRFDRLSTMIRMERRDRDYGYGYGPRH
jgi:hypothetical protein